MDDGGGGETALTEAPAAPAVVQITPLDRNKETMGFGVRPGPTENEWMKSGHKQTLWSVREVLSDIQNCDNTWDLSWTGEWRGDKIRQSLSVWCPPTQAYPPGEHLSFQRSFVWLIDG